MNCWHQSYILSLWTEEKGGSAGRGLYHERSKEVNLLQIYNMDSDNAMELDPHVNPNESVFPQRSQKRVWKHIGTLEWKLKRNVAPVPLEMHCSTEGEGFFGRWFFRRQLPHAGFLASANCGSGSDFSRGRHQGVIGLRRRLSSPLLSVAGGSGPSSHPTSSFLFGHTTVTTSKGACPVEEEDTCAAFVAGHASPTPTLMPQRSCRL
ncbi:hypothetical protein ZIOFF_056691 [Zingiber officinale]|uniref:Uncharacterized protein n=1 Tax=Zingiber officinale TaxID=94328 RepID=A0A8J5KFH6_ZINOF|nr:hypothetical protein ZIOFF_056691 [Zingiber officinale]